MNKQTGQWGTEYSRAQDLGKAPMKSDSVDTPVEKFTIAIEPSDARHGTLAMAWGTFRWTAPDRGAPMSRPTSCCHNRVTGATIYGRRPSDPVVTVLHLLTRHR